MDVFELVVRRFRRPDTLNYKKDGVWLSISANEMIGRARRIAAGLYALGVRPGDVIEYFFEAADNDPKGPNIAFTKPYRLEIISEEQYKQVLTRMAAKKALFEPYFKLGNWLRRLAERAREAERKAANAQTEAEREAAQKEARELEKELGDYEKALAKLMNSPATIQPIVPQTRIFGNCLSWSWMLWNARELDSPSVGM